MIFYQSIKSTEKKERRLIQDSKLLELGGDMCLICNDGQGVECCGKPKCVAKAFNTVENGKVFIPPPWLQDNPLMKYQMEKSIHNYDNCSEVVSPGSDSLAWDKKI